MSTAHPVDCTGYRPDGSACFCDARPFSVETDRPRPPVPVRPPAKTTTTVTEILDELCVRHDVTDAIDDLLRWSSDALGALTAIGSLNRFLMAGGPLSIVAPSILAEADRFEHATDNLSELLDRLRDVASEAALAELEPTHDG